MRPGAPDHTADIRWNTVHWPHEIAAHRYARAAGTMRAAASLETLPLFRLSAASSRATVSSPMRLASSKIRTFSSASHLPAEAAAEEVGPHEADACLVGARVEGERAPVFGDRALDLERQGALPVGPLASPGVVGVAGRDRLGRRGRVGLRGRTRARRSRRGHELQQEGEGERQACRTHFTSSGKVGFFPYIRMPTR